MTKKELSEAIQQANIWLALSKARNTVRYQWPHGETDEITVQEFIKDLNDGKFKRGGGPYEGDDRG